MITQERRRHVAVVGGGFTGMVCALQLLREGYRVTVFEAAEALGGLTSGFDFGTFRWDRFYHCILTSDRDLLALLAELGLEKELRWTFTQVGLYSHAGLHKMTSPADVLRFPHLSLFDKLRLGFAAYYVAHLRKGARLEKEPLGRWTRRLFGFKVWREVWDPLFRCKLGEMRHEASAAFLWGTLRRLYSTREKGAAKKEELGYVRGGYTTVFNALQGRVLELGAHVRTASPVTSVSGVEKNGETEGSSVAVLSKGLTSGFDAAILTSPNAHVLSCLETTDAAYRHSLEEVRYLGLVCVVLLLRRQLSPYYVTNITDDSPFTGVIEMTNLIDPELETAGFHLVYLPRYTAPADPLFDVSDDAVWEAFRPSLFRMHPGLREGDIADRFVFRNRVVQPVPTLNYSRIKPPALTPVKGVYLANTAQIVNNTLNNNIMVSIARDTCAQLMHDIPPEGDLNRRPDAVSLTSRLEEVSC